MITLVACGQETVEVTRIVTQEVEVEVTRLVEVEVTRVVEVPIENEPQIAGDPERGLDIYQTGGKTTGVMTTTSPCKDCHTLDGTIFRNRGPSFQGLSALAGERVLGLTAVEYLQQSIVDPDAYVVGDFSETMSSYKYSLNEEDLAALVAFLLTQ